LSCEKKKDKRRGALRGRWTAGVLHREEKKGGKEGDAFPLGKKEKREAVPCVHSGKGCSETAHRVRKGKEWRPASTTRPRKK